MFSDNNIANRGAICVLIVAPFWCHAQTDPTAAIDTSASERPVLNLPNYSLPQVEITATRLDLVNALDPYQVELPSDATPEEAIWALRHLPGAFSAGYGGPGGLQTISVGGGVATHTAILLDGIPLNSPQYGSLDLATLPLSTIGRIDYLPHGGTSVGSGSALSGAINLVPKMMTTGGSLSAGSYGNFRSEATLTSASKKFGMSLGKQSYDGNFVYRDDNTTAVRENNQFEKRHLITTYNTAMGATSIRASYWLTETERDIPGPTNRPTPGATQTDFWDLASVVLDVRGDGNRHRIQFYHQRQDFLYDSPDTNPSIFGKHDVTIIGGHYTVRRLWRESIASLSKIELRKESLTSTDADVHSRVPWSALQRVDLSVHDNVSLLATGRLSGIGSLDPWTSGEIAIRIGVPALKTVDQISFISSTNLHQPTFNDLYWQPGGNLDLLPERSTMIGSRIDLVFLAMSARIESYRTTYTDLIVWSPDAKGTWSPANIRAAVMADHIITVSLPTPFIKGKISAGGTVHRSKDMSDGSNRGRQLRYNPQGSGNFSIEATLLTGLRLIVQGAGQSRYIAYYNPPDDLYQEGHFSWNIHLKWRLDALINPEHSKFSTSVGLSLFNALDKNIQTVPGYPEPGRTTTLTIDLRRN